MINHSIQDRPYAFDDLPAGSHMKIIDIVGKGKSVLDVGCNKGYLAKEFKANGCHVVGIEHDPESAKAAKQFCDKVITEDLDTLEGLDIEKRSFDVIVFADVLEHLKNPVRVILILKEYLKPGGRIIVSVPNIARIDIRLKLLFGRFDYEDAGIMDRTHLRFFTIKSLKTMLSECGLGVSGIFYTGMADRLKILPNLLAFQFIIVAGERPDNA